MVDILNTNLDPDAAVRSLLTQRQADPQRLEDPEYCCLKC